jgi:GNAT superfamily N-acetyltransferase
VDDVVDVLHVMNDQPRDKLQIEDQTITVEQFREQEQLAFATGGEAWWLFARHDETGNLAGLTDVHWDPNQPETVFQGNTGVRPEHRGHAVGKWLKAAMLLRILDERPGVADIRTGNADSNDAMLGINRQLGFKPFIANTTWQVSLDQVRAYLAAT